MKTFGYPAGFDRLARHYRWMERVLAGNVLQRCRTAFLDRTLGAERVLMLGEGNGRFLVPFLEANTTAQVVCVEESGAMIVQAQKALARRGISAERVQFIQADVLEWMGPEGRFDLIVTHFFLDCFTPEQLQTLVPRIASTGCATCTWLWADFHLPSTGLRRLRARLVHRLMYLFFRAVTALPARRLTAPEPFLSDAGFQQAAGRTAQFGLVRSDCWLRQPAEARAGSGTHERERVPLGGCDKDY